MDGQSPVLEYKCPCCNAPLIFGAENQQMKCEYCDNMFDLATVQACAEAQIPEEKPEIQWDDTQKPEWSQEEQSQIRSFVCDACGGQLITDDHTAATFCPYCGNPTILPGRLSGGLKPDGVIPFKTRREDAQAAFLKLCSGKPLLPKLFTEQQQVEKITGIYVPFWLCDCEAEFDGSFRATRLHTWSDPRFIYTKTDHYLLRRRGQAAYAGIPMDGSSKMEDAFMESIEPFDYGELVDFDMAYLSGYLADKYDVDAASGEDRIRQRVENALSVQVQASTLGYASVIPTAQNLKISHGRARYVLLPVWLLNTSYAGKTYTFAMNGQTGKMTGQFPICPRRSAGWFCGIWAAAAAVVSLIQLVL
ncbi:MAG: hypothetical protein IJO21_06005 [Oscillospiraceae bacterium]|nr:hypothetical protein [Oscillospiraceae bacterium]